MTNSCHKNYNIANKFRQKPKRHAYCLDCKKALRLFIFKNGAILPCADYGIAVQLEKKLPALAR